MTIDITDEQIAETNQEDDIVLSVKDVSKKFCRDLKSSLFYGVQDIAIECMGMQRKSEKLRTKEFWALDQVSFELRRGEALGLVGSNGSGKTTILRIISGLIKPDTGSVKVKGRVAPLIALGAGFSPILTGRENIYTNMSILGLSTEEIEEVFEKVLDFAEIGDAIDAPVQSYSSGMAARLGFACAIHANSDILLIDEVLAVGDVRFREKCHRRLYELQQNGTSFILVTHNSQSILNVCSSLVYLSKGKLIATGDAATVLQQYEEDLFLNKAEKTTGVMTIDKETKSDSGLDITGLFFRDKEQQIIETPLSGEPTYFCVEFHADKEIENIGLLLFIKEVTKGGEKALLLSSFNDNKSWKAVPGKQEIQVQMPYLGLRPSLYSMRVVVRKDSLYTFDYVQAFKFMVKAKTNMHECLFYQPRTWEMVEKQVTDSPVDINNV